MRPSALLLFLTFALTLMGCVMYVSEHVGWAQTLWVFASGTAGGCVIALIEERK